MRAAHDVLSLTSPIITRSKMDSCFAPLWKACAYHRAINSLDTMKLISRLPTQFCHIAGGRGYGRPFSDLGPLNGDGTGRTYLSDDHRFRWRCYGPCLCRLGDEDGEVTYWSRYPTALRNRTEEARLSVKLGNEYMQQFLLYTPCLFLSYSIFQRVTFLYE